MDRQLDMQPNPKSRKIGLTLTSLASGGAEKQCLLLASLLGPYYRVIVIVIDEKPRHPIHTSFIADHNVRVRFLRGSFLKKIRDLRKIVKEEAIEIIFSYLPKDILFTAISVGSDISFHIGGIRNASMGHLKRKVLQYVHNKRLHASISNCHSGKTFFSHRGFNANKIEVIPNGIKIDMPPLNRVNNGRIQITSLGRLVEQKDYPTALKSIELLLGKLHSNDVELHYNIVGVGANMISLQEQIGILNLSDRVTITTNAQHISEILKETDIYLCTSIFEGLSNAIMEALVHSLPVVATDVGDNKILVKDQVNGYIVPPKDEVGIGNALERLILSPQLRHQMGAASYELVCTEYNLDLFLHRYLSYIRNL